MRTHILANAQNTLHADHTNYTKKCHIGGDSIGPNHPDRDPGSYKPLSRGRALGLAINLQHISSDQPPDHLYECLVEVVVKPRVQCEPVLEVLKTLNDATPADVVYVATADGGTRIVSRIRDSSSFFDGLPKMPSVASWALTHM